MLRKPVVKNAYINDDDDKYGEFVVVLLFSELPFFLEKLDRYCNKDNIAYGVSIIGEEIVFGCIYEEGVIGLEITCSFLDDEDGDNEDFLVHCFEGIYRFLGEEIVIKGEFCGAIADMEPISNE